MIRTVIITTGDELLYGTTADTNSAFVSWRLFGTDITVVRHITVGDNIDSIISALNSSQSEADIIIITGGLGPTDDDYTVEALCRFFNLKEYRDPFSEQRIKDFFNSMGMKIFEKDFKMASVPEGAYILKNRKGLAPGFVIEHDRKTFIAIPGVPAEAEKMFDEEVFPYLKEKFNFSEGNRLQFRLTGIRESDINSKINNLEFPEHIKWGVSAKSGICELIIVSTDDKFRDKDKIYNSIKTEFLNFIIPDEFTSPEDELIALLKSRHLTIATAESCTGGLIGKRLTDVAGSSEVFTGAVIAYSNKIKTGILAVPSDLIDTHGAVSEEVAAEMAFGIKRLFCTDIGISVTGIAGPGGGSDIKPVGTVCFGFCIGEQLITKKEFFKGDRERIRTFSSLYAINFIRRYLQNT